jgi:hypothetical protein
MSSNSMLSSSSIASLVPASMQANYAAMQSTYAKTIPFHLLALGVLIALGLSTEVSLSLAGLLVLSLGFGLASLPDDTEVVYIGIHCLVVAAALLTARFRMFSVDGLLHCGTSRCCRPAGIPAEPGRPNLVVTIWLAILICAGAVMFALIAMPNAQAALMNALPGAPEMKIVVIMVVRVMLCVFLIQSAVSILQGRKSGFYGLCVTVLLAIITGFCVSATMGLYSLAGLVAIAVTFGLLMIGGPNKYWSRMS